MFSPLTKITLNMKNEFFSWAFMTQNKKSNRKIERCREELQPHPKKV